MIISVLLEIPLSEEVEDYVSTDAVPLRLVTIILELVVLVVLLVV